MIFLNMDECGLIYMYVCMYVAVQLENANCASHETIEPLR